MLVFLNYHDMSPALSLLGNNTSLVGPLLELPNFYMKLLKCNSVHMKIGNSMYFDLSKNRDKVSYADMAVLVLREEKSEMVGGKELMIMMMVMIRSLLL